MKSKIMRNFIAVAGTATLALALNLPAVADSGEQAKLKELQRALSAPAQEDEFSPKAIVFDNDAAPAKSGAVAQSGAAASPADCSLLPADTPATPIDFEIQFKLGSAELTPTAEGTLRQIAKVLALTPDRCVFVEGHTDATGNSDINLKLSRERANSVVRFIVGKSGVLRSRLITFGKGSQETVKGLDPRDPKNRRVSFKVVG